MRGNGSPHDRFSMCMSGKGAMAEFNIYATVEGVFLAFETKAGQVAMVSAEAIAEALPQVARETVLKWCEEVQAGAEASGLGTGLPVQRDD